MVRLMYMVLIPMELLLPQRELLQVSIMTAAH